jgi:DNA-binding MarR family transcriptional regulator
MDKTNSSLRFNGSLWCNLDVALRRVDRIFRKSICPPELTTIEWYILRALYERDGQHASELAQAVGRAATSFTPNLDKLERRGLIERRPDRRSSAVRIFLTESGQAVREVVLESAEKIDAMLRKMFSERDFATFQAVLAALQATSEE